MILRKPYAFFIRLFKPFHVFIALLIAYLMYKTSKILDFLSTLISSTDISIASNVRNTYISNSIFAIPILVIIFSLLILGVMFKKKKPVIFYIVNIFVYIAIIVISLYTSNFLGVIEKTIVSIKAIKLIHDLVLINIILETVTFLFFLIRGVGLDFKKFDFQSDLLKFDISESDQEEVELEIIVDLNENRRKRNRNLRFFKYKYKENKFMYNAIVVMVILFVTITSFIIVRRVVSDNSEGNIYSVGYMSLSVENSSLLNMDYKGNKITNNILLVVNFKINSNYIETSINRNDFSVLINDIRYKPTIEYNKYLSDLGKFYDGSIIGSDFSNYILVFEIPIKDISSKMKLQYNFNNSQVDISLRPKVLENSTSIIVSQVGNELALKSTLEGINFKINDYDVNEKFLINYNYCIKSDDCILSTEYLKPSINKNFDKVILKLNVDFVNDSGLNIEDFYDFFEAYGSIYYKIDDVWEVQSSNFEEIKSIRTNTKNDVYIGVNSNVIDSTAFKLVFNIRNYRYEYLIK